MEAKKIKTIEMTRKVREKNARRLAGKSRAERIAFYREQAKKMQMRTPVLLKELETGCSDYSKDRHAWLDDQDVDTIAKAFERNAQHTRRSSTAAHHHGAPFLVP